MFEYKIPQEIKNRFTKEFMTDFLNGLIKVFELTESISYFDDLFYTESTCGWADVFKQTCEKHELDDVWAYYDKLNWYDSDLFDTELGSLMVEFKLVEE